MHAAKVTVRTLAAMRKKGEKIVALTAYDYHMARLEQNAGVHVILVGDSFQMAVFGEDSTLGAEMNVLVAHTAAVRRGAPSALVVADMPFGSYQASDEDAVRNAVRFVGEAGADAVKLEGGNHASVRRIRAIVDAGIPVMAHIGLQPQSIRSQGTYRVVRSDSREMLLEQVKAVSDAGAFSVVLEMVEEDVAASVTEASPVPTIGIGAGRKVDGQILVVNDMLGMNQGFNPKFLRKYADLHSVMKGAVEQYSEDVSAGLFPGAENVFTAKGKKS